jgi:hypothetical protein
MDIAGVNPRHMGQRSSSSGEARFWPWISTGTSLGQDALVEEVAVEGGVEEQRLTSVEEVEAGVGGGAG